MHTGFQYQMPEGISGFVNNNLGLLLVLFAIGALIAFGYKASFALSSLRRLRRTLTLMRNRPPSS
jgi:hypothetical protein